MSGTMNEIEKGRGFKYLKKKKFENVSDGLSVVHSKDEWYQLF